MEITPERIEERRQKVIKYRMKQDPRSPCIAQVQDDGTLKNCEFINESKDSERCVNCKDRIEYAIREEMYSKEVADKEAAQEEGIRSRRKFLMR